MSRPYEHLISQILTNIIPEIKMSVQHKTNITGHRKYDSASHSLNKLKFLNLQQRHNVHEAVFIHISITVMAVKKNFPDRVKLEFLFETSGKFSSHYGYFFCDIFNHWCNFHEILSNLAEISLARTKDITYGQALSTY